MTARIGTVWVSGDVFPTSPTPLQRLGFDRTDLGEPFHYDATRSKWLGAAIVTAGFGFSGQLASGNNGKTWGNELSDATFGWLAPFACTMVGWTIQAQNSSTASVRFFGSSTGALISASLSSATSAYNFAVDEDLDAGEIVYTTATSGTFLAGYEIVAYFRRRA